MKSDAIIETPLSRVPDLLAVYAFGSRIRGTAGPDSDLDLAVLVAGHADPLKLWQIAGDLADLAGCPVDLLDLRAASTVMQYQIITTGMRWWARDAQAALFEAAILSEKTELDRARSDLLADEALNSRSQALERYVARAREEYERAPDSFAFDFTRQDAAILNIQRACEAALDMGQHLIRREKLGVPQSARDVFALLARASWIEFDLADSLKRMVGFRNIAVHDYQSLQLPITVSIITTHLDDFLRYAQAVLRHDSNPTGKA